MNILVNRMQKKILIIDYNRRSLSSLKNLLQEQGYQVITAKDGLEGKSQFYEEKPDLIIMEPFISKLHGFDLLEEISESFTKQINLLMMTNFYSEAACQSYVLKYFKNSAFISKPYKDKEMKSKVSELLNQDSEISFKEKRDPEALLENKETEKKATSSSPQERQKKLSREKEIDSLYEEYVAKKKEKTQQAHLSSDKGREIDEILKKKLADFAHPLRKQGAPVKTSIQEEETAEEKKEGETIQENRKEEEKKPEGPEKEYRRAPLFNEYSAKESKKKIPRWIMFASGSAILGLALILLLAFPKNFYKKQEASQQFYKSGAIEQIDPDIEETSPAAAPVSVSEEYSAWPQDSREDIQRKTQMSGKEPPASPQASSPSGEENQDLAETLIKPADTIQESQEESFTPLPPPDFKQIPQPKIEEFTNHVLPESRPNKEDQKSGDPEPAAALEPAPEKKIETGDIIALNEVDSPPELVKKVDPEYTPAARKFKVSGKVVLVILISETGDVIETRIVQGIENSYGLNEKAERTVKKWKYNPAVKNGVKVKVWKTVAISFAEK
ncbi:MAG: TonB family protein [Candidatus Aminicenantes bacterium]|nr:TonB family protein [Candidatus Aminicenantes bacterium]